MPESKKGTQFKNSGQFQKGHAAFPNAGRPKSHLSRILSEYMQQVAEFPTKTGKQRARRDKFLVCRLFEKAVGSGNDALEAIKYIFDRLEGKPIQGHALEGDGGPLTLKIVQFGGKEAQGD